MHDRDMSPSLGLQVERRIDRLWFAGLSALPGIRPDAIPGIQPSGASRFQMASLPAGVFLHDGGWRKVESTNGP
jgi:hypothetical protein